jgi:hypothetical protein
MPRRPTTKSPSGVSRKPRATVSGDVTPPAEESSPATLRTPVFSDFDDVEETLIAIDEAAQRGPRRTALPTPRRDVG